MRSPSPANRPPINDAVALSKLALEFFESAKVLAEAGDAFFGIKRDHFFPFYYLVAHSIELMFKAYLRAHGFTDGELKKIGHDLDAGLLAAETEGLRTGAEFQKLVSWLNEYHVDHLFRYYESGISMQVPMPKALLETVEPELRSAFAQVAALVRAALRAKSKMTKSTTP